MKGSAETTTEEKEITLDYLFQLTMKKKWDEVVEVYRQQSWAQSAKLTHSEETALHVAVSSYQTESISPYESFIKEMIDCIPKGDVFDILSIQNDKGNTPLHLAAAVGWVAICECIAAKDRRLVGSRNLRNETPLFMAAHHGKLEAFLCLHEMYTKEQEEVDDSLCRRSDGNTILHSAIAGEYFRLAYQIISYYPKLMNSVNVKGESPLHVLAKKPNVFKSSIQLGLYDSLIYHCMFVDELKRQKYKPGAVHNGCSPRNINYPENYLTCANILHLVWIPIHKTITARLKDDTTGRRKQAGIDVENQQKSEAEFETQHVEEESKDINSFPANYATCIMLFKFAMKVILTVVGVGFDRVKKIKEKKERHAHAFRIMNLLIESESSYKYDSDGRQPVQKLQPQYSGRIALPDTPPSDDNHDLESSTGAISSNEGRFKNEKGKDQNKSVEKESPLLLAAKMGIPEMVEKILNTFPVAIQDIDSCGKNVLLLTAENRHANVFDYLLKIELPEYVFHQVDDEGNSILHLAAKLGDHQPWHIPGAALQMQWEIKWYKYVKSSIPPLCFAHNNKKGETPRKIFSNTHKKLVKEGTNWLIKTSESCSVVAALIAGVAFATSATVPGGLNQDTGYPIMEGRRAFDVFSITSLVALCLSVTALVFFLAIITSRCQEHDFKTNLPRKLLLGLTSLFASIAAMLVSFCAGHTFTLREKLRLAAVPIYAIACLPVTFFAVAQLPLYFDLMWAACRKVPLRSYKVFYQ
ncbi:uncharacterized protein LOC105158734 isoform X2 [Sesamum indicum]|uniref:Uncharacterized protein LOC105158734 isoform X2 n=1 Tax=Sesamum indicum TaxID=4182 RepID=A0A8M8UVW0_SESIN|nr:uncharacterized protein LOC105158734 isoform X2 [Sesamum indicum]